MFHLWKCVCFCFEITVSTILAFRQHLPLYKASGVWRKIKCLHLGLNASGNATARCVIFILTRQICNCTKGTQLFMSTPNVWNVRIKFYKFVCWSHLLQQVTYILQMVCLTQGHLLQQVTYVLQMVCLTQGHLLQQVTYVLEMLCLTQGLLLQHTGSASRKTSVAVLI
jgi:hypothetical protein